LLIFSPRNVARSMVEEHHERHENISGEPRIVMASYMFDNDKAYTRLFVESARYSGIDIVLIGDPAPKFVLPSNVRHLSVSWDDFVERISNRLFDGAELTQLTNATRYNVIDFKPAFAYLFPEVVHGYDWWGHLDNDMLLGNVRHFISREMLDEYDWIPGIGPHDRKIVKNWGPFTLYRNYNKTNDLFLQATSPLRELYDTQEPRYLDEWGEKYPGKSPYWSSTMSGIMTNNHKRMGIRVWTGSFPLVWDGSCKRGEKRCAECTLDMSPQAQIRLTNRVAHPNCTLEEECSKQEEVLLCHYQRSKKMLEASLKHAGDNDGMISRLFEVRWLRVDYLHGLVPLPLKDTL
jgi:hypothetical protein